MNKKELAILQFINEDPFISQNELAERTGLSRSAVAGYISSLIKQGEILGRAYVVPKKKQLLCIGGANIDRKIQVATKLEFGTSNPAKSSQSRGGVARNIAENLGRLGIDSALMTVVGEDHQGQWLLTNTETFVDIEPSLSLPNLETGTYTALLDKDGEMVVALADMSIYDTVQQEFIEKRWGYIANAEMVLIDTNFPKDVLKQIIDLCREEQIPMCVVPVSSPKARKLPNNLLGVTWLIANKEEAEVLSEITIESEGDFLKAAEEIMKKGVEKVVITRGDKGLVYYTKEGDAGVLLPPKVNITDVTGAGDSLVAGIIYGDLNGLRTEDACKIGMTCSLLTLQSPETVNPMLNKHMLQQSYKQHFI
ncbi:winged helix-turn-helix transcriptional regulator [Bacillus aquiflavi]|uniref:Winged helix-turn-helix transcriptional regulator n=1 Tax=Bacillus aquiflavi TaxID=2672567 RepID=A0A6B3VS62_9BACI|nr:carbohydrate kinase [Bacillus aquiflavi]MBA4536733.1 winged helix-turn-helix transcriptional regulator [Bacillus aquiflavi]NEY81100.1 winged helix-turn-helix transcriptional regulator [Bacillus aquiflavi]UAC48764.1 winged helix-turn-helix transcriptional regulator [Bacillus aquiflavi]